MSTAFDPSDVLASPKRWRFGLYFAVSLIPCSIWLVVLAGGGPGYHANRRPDRLDFALTVSSYLLIPALYGLIAIVPLVGGRGAGRRGFFVGAAVVGAVATALSLGFDLTFSGIDCRPDDCAPAVPDPSFFRAAYATSLLPAVVAPLLIAFVRWPRSDRARLPEHPSSA